MADLPGLIGTAGTEARAILRAVRRIGDSELEAAEGRREVDDLRRVVFQVRNRGVRTRDFVRLQVVEGEGRRIHAEDEAGRVGSGVGLQLAGIIFVAHADFTEAAAEIHPPFVNLVVASRSAIDTGSPIVRGAFQFDSATDDKAVVESLLGTEVHLPVLVDRLLPALGSIVRITWSGGSETVMVFIYVAVSGIPGTVDRYVKLRLCLASKEADRGQGSGS
jgi:hypothetical protein